MPGTTYTRKGPENDPVGRLADFARFATVELEEIGPRGHPPGVAFELRWAREHLARIAALMAGYTTADD